MERNTLCSTPIIILLIASINYNNLTLSRIALRTSSKHPNVQVLNHIEYCFIEAHIGRGDDFQTEGRGFDSHSNRHVGTLGKSFTYSCLCASRETPIQYPCCSRERL